MCAAKSPISMLQEYTMQNNVAFPHYDIIQQGTGFKCIVTVGHINRVAVAESKKRAKHLCAEQALAILQPIKISSTLPVSYKDSECTIHATIRFDVEEPAVNFVGKLNELCSQNGGAYPIYAELGCKEQKFIIQCNLLKFVTQGSASTKKQAKQRAAMEMLNRVHPSDFERSLLKESNIEPKKVPRSSEMGEKAVELFKELTLTKRQKVSQASFSLFDCEPFKINSQKLDDQEMYKSLDILNEIELREELSRLDVTYKISVWQEHPLMLCLKTAAINGMPSSYTFVHGGESYNDAVVVLLRKALNGIRILVK